MLHLRRFAWNLVVTTYRRPVAVCEKNTNLADYLRKSKYLSTQSSESSKATTTTSKSALKESVNLTDSCIKRLKHLKATDSKKRLRVLVDSGGCSGFEYKFSLDTEIKPDDIVVTKEGCEILIDQASLPFLQGATVDHYEELIRTGFRVIDNPNSEQGCSCGTSFSIKI